MPLIGSRTVGSTVALKLARSNFVAALPPTMFTDDNAGVELIVQSDTGTHAAKGGFH